MIDCRLRACDPFDGDMSSVLAEGFELVERGLLTQHEFRAFTFSNTVELHGGMNPDFFAGTIIEGTVSDVVAQHPVDKSDKTS